jgi:hypothetical protein
MCKFRKQKLPTLIKVEDLDYRVTVDIKTGKTGFFTALAKYSFHSAMSL